MIKLHTSTFILLINLTLIFTPQLAKCQLFTISELETLSTKNWDEFDTYVIKKGYIYDNSETDEIAEYKFYTFNKNYYSGTSSYWITLYKYSIDASIRLGYTNMVTWQTNISSDYIKIKDELKSKGYIFQNSTLLDGNTVNSYKKQKNEVRIILQKMKTDTGHEITIYTISLNIINK